MQTWEEPLGQRNEQDGEKEAAEKFLSAVERLTKELKTPTPAEIGIGREAFFKAIDKMAFDAMESGSPQNTAREVSEEDLKNIYKKLWEA